MASQRRNITPRHMNGGGPSETPEDTLTRVSTESTEGAQQFVESYYRALQHSKSTIASFYIPLVPGDKPLPDIALNGNVVPDGAAMQETYLRQLPQARFEILVVDCHPINTNYPNLSGAVASPAATMSILAMVGGQVKFGGEAETTFSETFVLVPNPDPEPPRGSGGGREIGAELRGGIGSRRRQFLIQSQTFRTVAVT